MSFFGWQQTNHWRVPRVTNLFRYGQCDSTADNKPTSGGETFAIDSTVPAPFSPQSIKVTVTSASIEGDTMSTGTGLAAVAGTVAVGSVYFKGTNGSSYRIHLDWKNTDASSTAGTVTTFTATGQWQLLSPVSTTVAAGKTGDQIRIVVVTDTARAESFWVANAMIQVGLPREFYIATSGGVTKTRPASLGDGHFYAPTLGR